MISLSTLDYVVIYALLSIILLVGLRMSRPASKNLESYFLGGRSLPWYLLGVSGMSAWFDLTGTMVITSFLYMLGPRGLYIEFRGGAVLVLAFMLAYTAKWHRRSGCMTSAEWTTYRFGTGASGESLRLVSALMGIATSVGTLAYLVRGATLFMAMIFPVDPVLLTLGILGLASIYTVLAGFYGVVLTNLIQGAIIMIGCVIVSVLAWQMVPSSAALAEVARQATGNAQWVASSPAWHTQMPRGYEAYESLVMAAMFYLARNILGGMSGGNVSRFFAARNSREASMQCLLQGVILMFRWPFMIGFAIMAVFLVARTLPDPKLAAGAAELIREANPDLGAGAWHAYTSSLVRHPDLAPAGLIEHLQSQLGSHWQTTLPLVGPNGTVNPEIVLPAVLMQSLAPGVRGLVIAALLAALLGALTGVVNGASALFVRDIYQNFLRPSAGNRELISSAYASSALIVAASFALGLTAPSVNDLWSWIMMGLTAGGLGPGLLRLYWWRTNAWGTAAGFLVGGLAATLQRWLMPGMNEWMLFVLTATLSLAATVAGSLATAPTPAHVVEYFHRTTRPFGWWGPFWRALPPETRAAWSREHRFDWITAGCALIWQVCLFFIPMQLLTRNWVGLCVTIPLFLAGCAALYFFWWRNLPPADEATADHTSRPPVHSGKEAAPAEVPLLPNTA